MIAMEFTSKFIHLIEGSASGSSVNVQRTMSLPVPERSIRNGYIRNATEIASVVQEAIIDNSLRKPVVISVDSTALKIKQAELPYETKERALLFMKRELGDLIAEEPYVIDYLIHRIFKRGKTKYMHCTMFAIPRDLLIEYSNLCKGLGLKVKRIDVLSEIVTKQLEIKYPKLKDKQKDKQKEGEENILLAEQSSSAGIKLWAGLYYEKIKLFTNGIDGKVFSKTIMLEGLESTSERTKTEEETDKERIMLYINEVKKFIEFQADISPNYQIEQIEVFGEHQRLEEISSLIKENAKKPTTIMQQPRQIRGVSTESYAKYMGAIGSLVRRQ